jgi:5,10-methylenetetrahydromethanopterin reductase
MKYGIAVLPGPSTAKVAQRAEELGFHRVWFYDSQLLCSDVFVIMATAAAATKKIRLATGVLIPSNRIAPVAANAFATLNAMAPGRIDCGIGTGFTARRTMALGPLKLSAMAEYLRVMKELWQGKTTTVELEGEPRKIRFMNQQPRFEYFNTKDPISVHVSAFAPKGRKLTAEIADGWIDFIIGDGAAIADVRRLDADARALGRDPKTLHKTGFTLGCVLAEGEAADGPRGRAQAAPQATVLFHNAVEAAERGSILDVPEPLRAPVEAYARTIYDKMQPKDERHLLIHDGHLTHLRPEEEAFVNADFLRRVTLTGRPNEIRERMRKYEAGGFDELVIQLVPGHESAIEDWAKVFDLR